MAMSKLGIWMIAAVLAITWSHAVMAVPPACLINGKPIDPAHLSLNSLNQSPLPTLPRCVAIYSSPETSEADVQNLKQIDKILTDLVVNTSNTGFAYQSLLKNLRAVGGDAAANSEGRCDTVPGGQTACMLQNLASSAQDMHDKYVKLVDAYNVIKSQGNLFYKTAEKVGQILHAPACQVQINGMTGQAISDAQNVLNVRFDFSGKPTKP
jgi:hypothetical protein